MVRDGKAGMRKQRKQGRQDGKGEMRETGLRDARGVVGKRNEETGSEGQLGKRQGEGKSKDDIMEY